MYDPDVCSPLLPYESESKESLLGRKPHWSHWNLPIKRIVWRSLFTWRFVVWILCIGPALGILSWVTKLNATGADDRFFCAYVISGYEPLVSVVPCPSFHVSQLVSARQRFSILPVG